MIFTFHTISSFLFFLFQVVRPSQSCEHDISQTLWRSFFKSATNLHLDSGTTRLQLGGQRSKVKVTVASQNMFLSSSTRFHQACLSRISSYFYQLSLVGLRRSKVPVTSYQCECDTSQLEGLTRPWLDEEDELRSVILVLLCPFPPELNVSGSFFWISKVLVWGLNCPSSVPGPIPLAVRT